jgi:hypothetical protein
MAKKRTVQRRVPHSSAPRTYGDGVPSQTAQQAAEAAGSAGSKSVQPAPAAGRRPAVGQSGVARSQVPLEQEYHYVPGDLKRLGILATITFVVMIALGIVIPMLGL